MTKYVHDDKLNQPLTTEIIADKVASIKKKSNYTYSAVSRYLMAQEFGWPLYFLMAQNRRGQ